MRVVAQNAPEAILDNLDEEGPDGDEDMRDANEEDAANGSKSQDLDAHQRPTHQGSPGRLTTQHGPTTQPAPEPTHGSRSREILVQTQSHHTPKMIPLDGRPLTARDKRQKATSARRSARRLAQRLGSHS